MSFLQVIYYFLKLKKIGIISNKSIKKRRKFFLFDLKYSSIIICYPLFDKNLFQIFHLKSLKNNLS